mmetsp:Transcript_8213/g.14935  ORF Transcript_8213/g.14935 Transcript_8213/m.14935 type:complete len:284 (-) Transcript_8213:276-1127(-)
MVSSGFFGLSISSIIWNSSLSSGLGATSMIRASGSSRLPKFRVPKATTSGAARAESLRYSSSCATVGNTIFTLFRSLFSPSKPAATGKMLSSKNCARISGLFVSSASLTSTSIRLCPPNIAASIAAPAESAASMTDEGATPNISLSSKYSYSYNIGLFSPEGKSDSSMYSVSIMSSSSSSSPSPPRPGFRPDLEFEPSPLALKISISSSKLEMVAYISSLSRFNFLISTCCFDVRASSCLIRSNRGSSIGSMIAAISSGGGEALVMFLASSGTSSDFVFLACR